MQQVLRICQIAGDFRRPGAPALRDLLEASPYRAIRPELHTVKLQDVIESTPDLVEDWLRFSEDKRTRDGWALGREDEGGGSCGSRSPKKGRQ